MLGSDAATDLAVLHLDQVPDGLTPIAVGSEDGLAVGQSVIVVGNPLGLSDTVTAGIISALDRPVVTQQESAESRPGASSAQTTSVTSAIQTSAAINPGNSGGALVNAAGELIGITSSIATLGTSDNSQTGSIGIGFAIPIDQVSSVVDQLLASGSVIHAYLGLSTQDGEAETKSGRVAGAVVESVESGSPAAEAGLAQGDVVTAINGEAITSSVDLLATVRNLTVGDEITVTVVRAGATQALRATLVDQPVAVGQ